MSEKHFDAILAKNAIARFIRNWKNDQTTATPEPLRMYHIVGELIAIENYIGEANQPCVKDIVEDEKGWL